MKIKSNSLFTTFAAAGVLIASNTFILADQTDDRIEESAKKSFVFRTFLKDDSVKTESKDGAVTLTGTVDSDFHKSLAADTVASISAVKSVDNQLIVKVDGPSETSDRRLVQKVKTMLLFHRNLSASKTDVTSQDGKVTLRGSASSQVQKELATKYTKDIEGVKGVDNEMVVAENKAEPGRTITEKIDDASITAQIKASLLTHRSTSALKTHIQTREGVVTVSGVASNAAEKALVTKLIGDIDGVSNVENNMTLP
ncbi:MAG: BON domain-containing protein [Gloeobacteraceae cyanobacterium ES-bin-144]|nr:BON domain-containing protein [Verrucomicrobiales bacterium]